MHSGVQMHATIVQCSSDAIAIEELLRLSC